MSLLTWIGGKGWKAKDYARKERGVWVITPATFYQAMIQHIKDSLASGDLPTELVDRKIKGEIDPTLAAKRYRNWARGISDQAWDDALTPLSLVGTHQRQLARAEALECARLWFTRALKNAETHPVYIRILKDNRFRLGVSTEFRA